MHANRHTRGQRWLAWVMAVVLCLGLLPGAALAAEEETASDLFFSQYIEGTSNNKALELYNGTGTNVDLDGYSIELHANGKENASNTLELTGTLNSGEVLVLYHNSASETLQAAAGSNAQSASVCNFNGADGDYILLLKNDVEIDVIGSKTEQSANHQNHGLTRKSSVTAPSTSYNEEEWDAVAITGDTAEAYAGLGSHTMTGEGGEATVAAPQADPQAGAVASGTEITLTCATADAQIYYTLDGGEPTADSALYSDASKPTITGEAGASVTLKAIAVLGENQSAVQTLNYTIQEDEPTTEAPIADGDQVVIYNPAYKKALSSARAAHADYYNKGVDITINGEQVTSYTDAEVWTVNDNGDGTWSFSNNGQNIGMDEEFTSMPQGGQYDKWEVQDQGDGTYHIYNPNREAYIEWFASNNYWSAYYTINSCLLYTSDAADE